MGLINILILWFTLVLILISISLNLNQTKKQTKQNKTKLRKTICSIKMKNKQPEVVEESQTSNQKTNSVPEQKKADVFIADFEQKKDNKCQYEKNNQEEPIAEPIEENIEQIENEGEVLTEVEEDEPFFANIQVENVFDKFFSKENIPKSSTYTVETAENEVNKTDALEDEINGEYNTFSNSEEPWYEHESVRKLISDNNSVFVKEPKKFEIERKSY